MPSGDPANTMNLNNDNSNSDVKVIETAARESFFQIAKRAARVLLEQGYAVWKSPDEAKYYRAENAVVAKHTEPLNRGLMVAGVLFFMFRINSSSRLRRLFQTTTYSTNPTKTTHPNNNNNTVWKPHLERQTEETEGIQRDLTQLPLDAFVSIMCGLSTVVWFTQPSKIVKDLCEAPLLHGKSLVASHVCPNAEEVFAKLPTPVEGDTQRHHNNDLYYYRALQTLVQNCRIRQITIQQQIERGDDLSNVVRFPGLTGYAWNSKQ